eukprot:4490549-Pyramimonas_sp.AAC.1
MSPISVAGLGCPRVPGGARGCPGGPECRGARVPCSPIALYPYSPVALITLQPYSPNNPIAQ